MAKPKCLTAVWKRTSVVSCQLTLRLGASILIGPNIGTIRAITLLFIQRPSRSSMAVTQPFLLPFERGSTVNYELEQALVERDNRLADLKASLSRAQESMRWSADKNRRDVNFEIGDKVFLKLRPYRQQSVTRRQVGGKLLWPI